MGLVLHRPACPGCAGQGARGRKARGAASPFVAQETTAVQADSGELALPTESVRSAAAVLRSGTAARSEPRSLGEWVWARSPQTRTAHAGDRCHALELVPDL